MSKVKKKNPVICRTVHTVGSKEICPCDAERSNRVPATKFKLVVICRCGSERDSVRGQLPQILELLLQMSNWLWRDDHGARACAIAWGVAQRPYGI